MPSSPSSNPSSSSGNALPPLTTDVLTTKPDLLHALRLITDSIAQQRQLAAQSLILSPLFVASWVLMLALLIHTQYHALSDVGIIATTGSGITMAMLLFCRWMCEGFVRRAEKVAVEGVEWFKKGEGKGEETVVLGTRYGEELIGTVVLRFPAKDKVPISAFYDDLPKVEVRAWTVRLRFRGKGIGRGLLEEVVKLAMEREGSDVKLVFAKDHANAVIDGPKMLNGVFRKREARAEKLLRDVVAEARSDEVGDLM